ncbi:MAG: nucleotidyltransferase domain-containing protein [Nanoarchaeota archaeon]|nr:nucleotidyltransferase domain-containing protein [Nanoarchaeota archaeon]
MASRIKGVNNISAVDTLQSNEAHLKVLHWFFSYPTGAIGLNDLADALDIAKTTAKTIVLQLIEEGFLQREILGRMWRITVNSKHPYNFTRKICYNLNMISESGIIPLIYKLLDNPKAIILFGSYRKGDDNEKSDIDIAVEISGNDDVQIMELGKISRFGYRKNVAVNAYIFSRNRIDLNIFANIANGIVLDGFLEVRP